jgi:hypothetical protein
MARDCLAALAPLVLEQAAAGGEMDSAPTRSRGPASCSIDCRDRRTEHTSFCGGRACLCTRCFPKKTNRPILEPNADALTGSWLVATGQAPEERALPFGETMEQS